MRNPASRAESLLRRLERQGISVSHDGTGGLTIAAPRSLPQPVRESLQLRAQRSLQRLMPGVHEALTARERVPSDFNLPWPHEFSERLARRLWQRLEAFVNGPRPSSPEYEHAMRAFYDEHGHRRFTQVGSLMGGWLFPLPENSSAIGRLGDCWIKLREALELLESGGTPLDGFSAHPNLVILARGGRVTWGLEWADAEEDVGKLTRELITAVMLLRHPSMRGLVRKCAGTCKPGRFMLRHRADRRRAYCDECRRVA